MGFVSNYTTFRLCSALFCSVLIAMFLPVKVLADDTILNQEWRFHPGDNLNWAAAEFDDSAWSKRRVPDAWGGAGFPETQQFAWYRTKLIYDHKRHGNINDIGLRLGAIRSAYEVYAGGRLLGGVGNLPPQAKTNFDKIGIYRVNAEDWGADASLHIALRVWGGSDLAVSKKGGGPYKGEVVLGNYTELIRALDADQIFVLLSACLFVCFAIYFLYLFYRNPQLDSFLWFSLNAIIVAIYSLTQSQWKYTLDWPFLVYEKIESASIYLFSALLIQLTWTVVDKPIGPMLRAYQLGFVLLAITVAAVPGMTIHYLVQGYWLIAAIAGLFLMLWVVQQQARSGNPEARTMFAAALICTLCSINDLLLNMEMINSPRMVSIGFLAVLLSMIVSLANRFTGMFNSLEIQVVERTEQLTQANQQLSEATQKYQQLSRVDLLTGLLNRRGFIEDAEAEMQRYMRNSQSFAVVLADIDFFKRVNDDHGHACGDAVLQKIARLMQQRLREVDRVSRWGGEEFIFLLPETGIEGALEVAESLRLAVAQTNFEFGGSRLKLSLTFGVALYQNGQSLDDCIAQADAALYKGKQSGRNRVQRAVDSALAADTTT